MRPILSMLASKRGMAEQHKLNIQRQPGGILFLVGEEGEG